MQSRSAISVMLASGSFRMLASRAWWRRETAGQQSKDCDGEETSTTCVPSPFLVAFRSQSGRSRRPSGMGKSGQLAKKAATLIQVLWGSRYIG
jgi:hypothetical protein